MAQWLSWLERRPVTAEVTGSSPVWVVQWDLSSAGRASALQAGGHRFEPYSDHHLYIEKQLRHMCVLLHNRTNQKAFFIYTAWQFSWLECRPVTAEVDGSSPFQVAIFLLSLYGFIAQLVEQRTENPCVTGSIPVEATIKNLELIEVLFFIKILKRPFCHLLIFQFFIFYFFI